MSVQKRRTIETYLKFFLLTQTEGNKKYKLAVHSHD